MATERFNQTAEEWRREWHDSDALNSPGCETSQGNKMLLPATNWYFPDSVMNRGSSWTLWLIISFGSVSVNEWIRNVVWLFNEERRHNKKVRHRKEQRDEDRKKRHEPSHGIRNASMGSDFRVEGARRGANSPLNVTEPCHLQEATKHEAT